MCHSARRVEGTAARAKQHGSVVISHASLSLCRPVWTATSVQPLFPYSQAAPSVIP